MATTTIETTNHRGGLRRRFSRVLYQHPRLRLALLLGGPLTWLLVAYVGSLVALLVTSLYHFQSDPTGLVQRLVTTPSATNYQRVLDTQVYRTVAFRTVGAALGVTVIDLLIALPVAFYMAKIARPWVRRALVVGVTMPLWAGYLVKGYAWRAMLDPAGGVLHQVFGHSPGFGLSGTILTLSYLWLPYMIIPIYSGLERLPNSLLEASTDLGAKAGRTFVKIVLPQLRPSIVAGSIFTFALTLGDFYMAQIVGGTTQFLGNVVYREFSANLPFAAAYATVPVVVMIAYLAAARSSGALEEL
ncbi:MAG: putative spermidine/putrescine transport system permease protein [Actinomycetota bacterium]|jgi:putative spermidine/putrescine transport system permease protein|nr:putative spermidine/putrescine transport system permease protein [Actinomycetota bacterium]